MPELKCHTCTSVDQKRLGCTAKHYYREGDPEPVWIRPAALPVTLEGGFDDFACPRQHIHEHPDFWGQVLKYYGMWKKGHLPDRGAATDQSNFAIEVFSIFDVANQEADDELREQDAQRNTRDQFRP